MTSVVTSQKSFATIMWNTWGPLNGTPFPAITDGSKKPMSNRNNDKTQTRQHLPGILFILQSSETDDWKGFVSAHQRLLTLCNVLQDVLVIPLYVCGAAQHLPRFVLSAHVST